MDNTQTAASAPQPWHARVKRQGIQIVQTGLDLLNQFVWRDLREGMLDLKPLPRSLRLLITGGLTLTILLLLLITQTGWVRTTFDLRSSLVLIPGRGLLIPSILYPLAFFLLSIAWTFGLTGAAFAAWPIRLSLLGLYWLTIISWLVSLPVMAPGFALLGAVFVLLTTIAVLASPALRRRPLRLFAFLLLTVGGLFASIHGPFVTQDRISGMAIGAANLENNLRALSILAMPLLVLVGLDIADFTQHAAEWATEAAAALMPQTIGIPVAVGALIWLLVASVIGWRDAPAVNQTLASVAGILTLIGLLIGAWFLLIRFARGSLPLSGNSVMRATSRLATPVVLLYFLPPLLSFLLLEITLVIQIIALVAEGMAAFGVPVPGVDLMLRGAQVIYVGALSFSTFVNASINTWLRWIMVSLLVLTPVALRRNRIGMAFAMVSIGVHYLWLDLTRPGGTFGAFTWDDGNFLALAWSVVLTVIIGVRLLRGQGGRALVTRALVIIVILTLLRHTDFIEDPFSPFFAFAGLGFLAFGIGWDLITSGRWANQSSRALPQAARIFLYIGYLLITVTLVNWAVHSHDLSQINQFTGDAALFGFFVLGRPYLYLLIFGLAMDFIRLETDAEPKEATNVSVPAESPGVSS